jgi:hypothetical protein
MSCRDRRRARARADAFTHLWEKERERERERERGLLEHECEWTLRKVTAIERSVVQRNSDIDMYFRGMFRRRGAEIGSERWTSRTCGKGSFAYMCHAG